MASFRHNFTIYQGLTFGGKQIIAVDSSGNPVPQEAGTTYLLQARRSIGADLAFEIPVERGTEAEGQILMPEMDTTATAALPEGEWMYDMIPVDAEDAPWPPIMHGVITVKQAITTPI